MKDKLIYMMDDNYDTWYCVDNLYDKDFAEWIKDNALYVLSETEVIEQWSSNNSKYFNVYDCCISYLPDDPDIEEVASIFLSYKYVDLIDGTDEYKEFVKRYINDIKKHYCQSEEEVKYFEGILKRD